MSKHAEWLEDRRKSIGGSEVACLLGCARWGSLLQIYHSKRGNAPDHEGDMERLQMGLALEPAIADIARAVIGPDYAVIDDAETIAALMREQGLEATVFQFGEKHLKFSRSQCVVRNPSYPRSHATPDAIIQHRESGKLWVAEWKASSEFMASEWNEGTPEYYTAQARHNAAVTGLDGCFVGVLLGTGSFKSEFIAGFENPTAHLGMVEKWWRDHIVAMVEPEAGAGDDGFLIRLHPDHSGDPIQLQSEQAMRDDFAYAELAEQLKQLEEQKKAIRARFRQRLGSARCGTLPDGSQWVFNARGALSRKDG